MRFTKLLLALGILSVFSTSYAQNVGIGTNNPQEKLDVDGTVKAQGLMLPPGAADQRILISDTAGNASWGDFSISQLLGVNGDSIPCSVSQINSQSSGGTGPTCIVESGGYAYVTNETSNTLTIFDLSNPALPNPVGSIVTGVYPRSVAVQGNYAYVLNITDNTMVTVDVGSPSSPSIVSTIATGTSPFSVDCHTNYAAVVNLSSSELMIYDLANPVNPVLAATVATATASPYNVKAEGNLVYLSTNSGNFEIYDVTTLSSPVLLSTTSLSGQGFNVVVSNNLAFLAVRDSFEIYDVSTPAAPVKLSASPTPGVCINLAYDEVTNSVFTSNQGSSQIMHFSVSDPSSPVLVGTYAAGGGPRYLSYSNPYLYAVTQSGATLLTYFYDCANRTVVFNPSTNSFEVQPMVEPDFWEPNGTSNFLPKYNASGDDLVNSYLFERDSFVGIGTTNPTSTLDLVGSFKYRDGNEGAGKVLVSDSFGNANWANFFDQNLDGSAPINVACIPSGSGSPRGRHLVGNILYGVFTGSPDMLGIFDVSDPENPVQLSTITTSLIYPTGVFVEGNYAYVASQFTDRIVIFDVSNPSAPAYVNEVSTGINSDPVAVVVESGDLYVACIRADIIQRYDLATPTNPTLLNQIGTVGFSSLINGPNEIISAGGSIYWVENVGNRVSKANLALGSTSFYSTNIAVPQALASNGNYIAVGNTGSALVQILDLNLNFISSITPSGPTSIQDLDFVGNTILVGGSGQIAVIDVSNINNPQQTSNFPAQHYAVAQSSEYIFGLNGQLCSYKKDPTVGALTLLQDGSVGVVAVPSVSGSADYLAKFNSTGDGVEDSYVKATNSGLDIVTNGTNYIDVFSRDASNNNLAYLTTGVLTTGTAIFWNRLNHRIQFGTNDLPRMTIENNGNVGIGTQTPGSYKLRVEGTTYVGSLLSISDDWGLRDNGEDFELIEVDDGNKQYLIVRDGGAWDFRYAGSGTVDNFIRMERSSSSGNELNWRPGAFNYNSIGSASYAWDDGYFTELYRTSEFTLSDAKTKMNFRTLDQDSSLAKLMALQPLKYDLNPDTHPFLKNLKEDEIHLTKDQLGFTAQNLNEVLPEMVRRHDEMDVLTVLNYEQMFPVIVSGMQAQQKQIEGQNQRIEEQSRLIEQLLLRIEELEKE